MNPVTYRVDVNKFESVLSTVWFFSRVRNKKSRVIDRRSVVLLTFRVKQNSLHFVVALF